MGEICVILSLHEAQVDVWNLPMFGKTMGMSAALTPLTTMQAWRRIVRPTRALSTEAPETFSAFPLWCATRR